MFIVDTGFSGDSFILEASPSVWGSYFLPPVCLLAKSVFPFLVVSIFLHQGSRGGMCEVECSWTVGKMVRLFLSVFYKFFYELLPLISYLFSKNLRSLWGLGKEKISPCGMWLIFVQSIFLCAVHSVPLFLAYSTCRM